jgi:hypothetical protein
MYNRLMIVLHVQKLLYLTIPSSEEGSALHFESSKQETSRRAAARNRNDNFVVRALPVYFVHDCSQRLKPIIIHKALLAAGINFY